MCWGPAGVGGQHLHQIEAVGNHALVALFNSRQAQVVLQPDSRWLCLGGVWCFVGHLVALYAFSRPKMRPQV